MASRKKQPEGIALLSMYNDDEEEEEEEDEEMEDLNAQPQLDEDEPQREPNQMESDSDKEIPEDSNLTANNPFVAGLHKSPGDVIRVLSPGNEVASIPSEQLELLEAARTSDIVMEAKASQVDDTGFVPEEDFDLLNRFLPPAPKEKCQEELQKKIERFLALKKVGRSFNAEVRNRKDYRNPDFLLHAVRYQDIDQVGSCFSKDVFDPHGYDKSDYYDEIEMDMKRERERREQELKRSPKVEFVGGGTQPGTVLAPPKFSVPVSGSSVLSLPSTTDTSARDGKQSKKSKWDTVKVGPDGRNLIPTGNHESLSTAAAHAALLSAANVGSGYTAFVQQKRREAEEKKSSDRKLERRS